MNGLLMHRGGQEVTRDSLSLIEVPPATDSYLPVPHIHLVDTLATISRDILTGFTLHKEQFGLAREGQQLFGVMTYKNSRDDMGLSIGFRNSYDRSMSIGIAIGGSVFVCDNLSLSGDITIMRKHTLNVWKNLEDTVISTLYRSQKDFEKVVADSERMRGLPIDNTEAFKMIGLLFGRGVLSPRQLPVVKDEWLKPRHEDFKPRNVWSYYNACTEALKSCPPLNIMDKHIELHKTITGVYA